MQFHHDEQSKFFCMKADCVASLKEQGKKYDKAIHLITVINRDDLVPLLNFMCLPTFDTAPGCLLAPTMLGVKSSGATLVEKPDADEPIPDCVPAFLRKAWGH